MPRDWETDFRAWAAAPSRTQEQKAENAEGMVHKAIAASPQLQQKNIEVFTQGSYRNRTNVREESDVDVCVRCMDSFFGDYSTVTWEQATVNKATYMFPEFKNDVEVALRSYFGDDGVHRGDKAFDIHENTYRIDADVVACLEHRRWYRTGSGIYYLSGIEFIAGGKRVISWPHQHYQNGIQKNEATSRRFKRTVRILKRLRNGMAENGNKVARGIPSYLVECLVWNAPNEAFNHSTYTADVRWSLAHLWNNTRDPSTCGEWGEVNELKYLFREGQPWTREQAWSFVNEAWNYIGFE